MPLVQLGGLEPPTSCSTDRRSNQLSYNCILYRPQKGSPNGRKLGVTHSFGKAGTRPGDDNIRAVLAYAGDPYAEELSVRRWSQILGYKAAGGYVSCVRGTTSGML